MATSSGITLWQPAIAEILTDALERIGVFGPGIEQRHVVSGRRSLNMVCSDLSGNRGINLWRVSNDIQIPLVTGVAEYLIPEDTVNILDSYIRTFQADTTSSSDQGFALTPILDQNGFPLISQPWGDPLVIQPGSTLSCTAGSQVISFYWPGHGLTVGEPIFWGCPISIGAVQISGFSIVSRVVDQDNLEFLAPIPVLETQTGTGETRLFYSTVGSDTVTCIFPGHGLGVGDTTTIDFDVVLGGITLAAGDVETVVSVANAFTFTFVPGGTASSTVAAFENDGQLNVSVQTSTVEATDVFMYPISRNDYAMLPNKFAQGRPTSYWYDRLISPKLTVWPVPPSSTNSLQYAFIAYRTKNIQVANPEDGQILDAPQRLIPAITAELTASLAEKFAPSMWAEKLQYAEMLWNRAADADVEHVSTWIAPTLDSYYR